MLYSRFLLVILSLNIFMYYYFLNIYLFYFLVVGSLLLMWTFSSCDEQGLLSSCSAQASHCSGFPCTEYRLCAHEV